MLLGFHRSVLIFHSCSEADLHFFFFSLTTIFVITTVAIVTKSHSHLISQRLRCIYTSSYATTSDYSTNHDVTACQRLSVSHFPKKRSYLWASQIFYLPIPGTYFKDVSWGHFLCQLLNYSRSWQETDGTFKRSD